MTDTLASILFHGVTLVRDDHFHNRISHLSSLGVGPAEGVKDQALRNQPYPTRLELSERASFRDAKLQCGPAKLVDPITCRMLEIR